MPRVDNARPPSMGGPTREPGENFTPGLRRPKPAATGQTDEPKAPGPLQQAYDRWTTERTPQALHAAVEQADDVLNAAATTFAGGMNPLVRGQARVLAARAIRNYDPKAGASLKTWLMGNLQGLTRYRRQLSPIRTPERVQLDLALLNRSRRELTEENGREPTPEEMAEHSGLSLKRIRHVQRSALPVVAEGRLVDNEGASYLPGVDEEHPDALWAEMVYHDMDPINKQIYDMTLGRNGQKPMLVKDIAAKLKISSPAISQRALRIADMLEQGKQMRGQF